MSVRFICLGNFSLFFYVLYDDFIWLCKVESNYDFGKRLKELRESFGLTQSDLATKIGVSITTIQNFEANNLPKSQYVIKLSEILNCSTDWLLKGSNQNTLCAIGVDDIEIPFIDVVLSAGGGNHIDNEVILKKYRFPKRLIRSISNSPNNLYLVKVKGDSMRPTVMDKDLVMIDTCRKSINSGYIYALRIQDYISIKRLEPLPKNKVIVISDNKEYEPFQYDLSELTVVGQVIWLSRKFA